MGENQNVLSILNIKFCIVLAFPIILSPLLFLGESNDKKLKCVFVIVLTTGYALIQAFPMHVAFLLPIILLPPLGIVDTGAVIANYMKETAMIVIGLTTLAIAIQRSNLQNRLIYKILLLTGLSPAKLLTGVLFGSAFISMWVGAIFVVTVMFPIISAITEELDKEHNTSTKVSADEIELTELNVHFEDQLDQLDTETVSSKKKPLLQDQSLAVKKALLLSLVSAYSIGSRGTIYGNQVTILYKEILESQGTFDKSELNFVSWTLYNIPIVLLALGSSWFILAISFFSFPCQKRIDTNTNECDDSIVIRQEKEAQNVQNMLRQRYKDLGPLSAQEMGTLGMMVCLILIWFTREPKVFTGWNSLFPEKNVGDAVPAILIAFLLLILPYKWPRKNQPYETFISWKYLQDRFPWGVLLIFGGNFALSEAVAKSGLSLWIEDQLGYLDNLPKEVILLILMGICCFGTQFLSGTLFLIVLYPIITSMSWRLEIHPLYFGLPVSLACGYSFMLPLASPYAALVYALAEGDVTIPDMIKTGIGQSIACVIIVFFFNMWWGEYVFNYSDYSNYVNNSTTITTIIV